jgi:hypothetical protein
MRHSIIDVPEYDLERLTLGIHSFGIVDDMRLAPYYSRAAP